MNRRLLPNFRRSSATAAALLLFSVGLGLGTAEPTPSSSWAKSFGSQSGTTGATAAAAPASAVGQEAKVKGTFEWSNKKGEQHDLEGKLTRTSDKEWKVVWDFKWSNKPVTYEGIVQGDINNGDISGTGDEVKGKRKFSFEGKAKDGVWKFECFEVTQGKKAQGTGELTVQK